jgi:hypothetical protein
MRILFAIVLFCDLLFALGAQSQQRPQQPRIIQPPATTEQPKTTEDQRGTEQSPVIVKIIPTTKTDDERAQEKTDRDRIADSERKKEQSDADLVRYTAELADFTRRLFYATIVLAIATAGLLVAAFIQSRDTKATIEQAKRSADIAERALAELEAPFVFVQINTPGLNVKGNSVSFGMLQWCVINYGRTPASILEVFEDVVSVERGHSPQPVNPKERQGTQLPYGVITPPNGGQSHDFPAIAIGPFLQSPGMLDQPPTHSPFFVGFVRYADIFRDRFILGFCFLFDFGSNAWIRVLGDEYNYCRKEQKD